MEVKDIERELAQPMNVAPRVIRTVCHRGNEFDVLEEEQASGEVKELKADLSAMMGHIEVS